MESKKVTSRNKVETISAYTVAKLLCTSPMIVKAAIKSGMLPIGFVARKDGSTQDRVVIVKARFIRWINGNDIDINH